MKYPKVLTPHQRTMENIRAGTRNTGVARSPDSWWQHDLGMIGTEEGPSGIMTELLAGGLKNYGQVGGYGDAGIMDSIMAGLDMPGAEVLAKGSTLAAGGVLGLLMNQGGDVGRLARGLPGQRGLIGGEDAYTANLDKLASAKEKHAAGGWTRDSIWDETGWYLDKDKKWKFEIPDQDMSIRSPNVDDAWDTGHTGGYSLGEIINHEKLFDAYPYLKGTPVNFDGDMVHGDIGSAIQNLHGGTKRIDINSNYPVESKKGTLLHEVQHAIQGVEGFGLGGNPRDAWSMYSYDATQELERVADGIASGNMLFDEPAYNRLKGRFDSMSGKPIERHTIYKELLGEAEARNVDTRKYMTDVNRMETPPWMTYDVPESLLIPRDYHGKPLGNDIFNLMMMTPK